MRYSNKFYHTFTSAVLQMLLAFVTNFPLSKISSLKYFSVRALASYYSNQ